MKRLLMIINPRSGKEQLKGKMVDILDLAVKAGYDTEVYVTQCQADARRVAREKGWQFDLVVCCGGDGTLNETVSGLMDEVFLFSVRVDPEFNSFLHYPILSFCLCDVFWFSIYCFTVSSGAPPTVDTK